MSFVAGALETICAFLSNLYATSWEKTLQSIGILSDEMRKSPGKTNFNSFETIEKHFNIMDNFIHIQMTYHISWIVFVFTTEVQRRRHKKNSIAYNNWVAYEYCSHQRNWFTAGDEWVLFLFCWLINNIDEYEIVSLFFFVNAN